MPTALLMGLASCDRCGLVSRVPRPSRTGRTGNALCPRCRSQLQFRKSDSLQRTSAFLMAAALLFVPANLLPVMTTRTLLKEQRDTIVSGVISLWHAGSWPLAVLVFAASVVVPVLKISALAVLVISTARQSRWHPRARTRLYRWVDRVGRWSMLDVFVMALLAALVRSRMASVEIHAGAIAFGLVVVMTMLASQSFDPRLMWDQHAPPSPRGPS